MPQSEQKSMDVAAVPEKNFPAAHEEQAEDSTPVAESVRYFPAVHSVQAGEDAEE